MKIDLRTCHVGYHCKTGLPTLKILYHWLNDGVADHRNRHLFRQEKHQLKILQRKPLVEDSRCYAERKVLEDPGGVGMLTTLRKCAGLM